MGNISLVQEPGTSKISVRTIIIIESSCDRADSVMDSHNTGPGFKTRLVRYFLPSFLLP